jgi:hypothetical protein
MLGISMIYQTSGLDKIWGIFGQIISTILALWMGGNHGKMNLVFWPNK